MQNDPAQEIFKFPRLDVNGQLFLHTRLAQSLFNGSWRHGKMGLLQFARIMALVFRAAREDDPYAEWYLLKTYQALFDVNQKLKSIELQLTEYFKNLRGVTVNLLSSDRPLSCPLHFSTPFGFMGAYLLADFDYVFRQTVTLKRIGLSLKEDITVKQLMSYLQNAFSMPRYWHQTGITRQDVIDNTEKYQKNKASMGEIPEVILKKEIEFSFMPKKKRD